MIRGRSLFLFIFLTSPAVWLTLVRPTVSLQELSSFPKATDRHLVSIFAEANIRHIVELRESNVVSRILYNKLTLVSREAGLFVSHLAPHKYFSGNTYGYPAEPIPMVLLPFVFAGLVESLKNRKVLLGLLAISPIPAYLAAYDNLLLNMPTIMAFLGLTAYGFERVDANKRKLIAAVIGIYVIYLAGRIIWHIR